MVPRMKTRTHFLIICLMLTMICPACLNASLVVSPTGEGNVRICSECRHPSPGEIVKISLQSPVPVYATLSFDGREYIFTAESDDNLQQFALIALGVDVEPGVYGVVVHLESLDGTRKDIPFKLAVSEKEFPSQKIQVARSFTSPSPAAVKRIKSDKEMLSRIYTVSTPDWLGDGGFIMPLSGGISGVFGARRVFNRGFVSRHRGVDIRSPAGTSVKASNSGEVVLARNLYFSGDTVIIHHGIGLFSIYCHMSKTVVEEGVFVDKGETIGYTGSTGRSTGPHLHWGLRLADTYADPLSIVYLSFD